MEIWIVIVIIVVVALGIGGLAFTISKNQKFKEELEENINTEIKKFLIKKHNPNYEFKNYEIEEELRNRLKAAMIDLRTGRSYKPSYMNRTTNKDKEIYSIINKYYILDRKASK